MTTTPIDWREGANGRKYNASIRTIAPGQHRPVIESEGAPLYLGAVFTSKEAARRDALKMLSVYCNIPE